MEYIAVGGMCTVAIAFFSLSVRSSIKNSAISGVLGGLSFVLYMFLGTFMSEAGAVFFATLAGCLGAEVVARIAKTPATVFSIPVIIPLVPGIMLYQTMLKFGQGNNYSDGVHSAVQTLIVAGSLSLAVTLATLIAKLITKFQREHKK